MDPSQGPVVSLYMERAYCTTATAVCNDDDDDDITTCIQVVSGTSRANSSSGREL